MSHKATNWAFQQRGLRPSAWRVLAMLADRHNPDHGCFPSQDQLAADCEISRSGLNLILEELEAAGLIRRERRVNPDTRKQMSTRYILGFEPGFAQAPSPETGLGKPQKPCPENAESRVQNLDTNPVREPVNTTAHPRETGPAEATLACLAACGPGLCDSSRAAVALTGDVVEGWLAEGLDLALDILPVLRARTATPTERVVRTWAYFTPAIRHAHTRRKRPASRVQSAENQHASRQPLESGAASDPVVRMAGWLNSGRVVPPSAVTNTMRDELLRRGLVTGELLRTRQIY